MKRCIIILLVFTLLFQFIPNFLPYAEATTSAAKEFTGSYPIASIAHQNSCGLMQGMALLGDYIYSAKINTGDTKAMLYRTERKTGKTVAMTIDGAVTSDQLGHANDLCAATINGNDYLFATTLKTGTAAIVAMKISGTAATILGVYTLKKNDSAGTALVCSGLSTYSVNGNSVELLLVLEGTHYLTTLDVTSSNRILIARFAFSINMAQLKSLAREISNAPQGTITIQGTGYGNDTYYIPITVDYHSVIMVYPNISQAVKEGAVGITTTADRCIRVSSGNYPFFEIESVGISGDLIYFNANRKRLTGIVESVVSLLTHGDAERQDAMDRFRDDGFYQICPSSDPNHVLSWDTGDTFLLAASSNAEAQQFGMVSDREGYYTIQNRQSKLFFTANSNHSITLETASGSDNQLWSMKFVNNTIVGFQNKATHEYLSHDANANGICTTEEIKTWILQQCRDISSLESILFDYELYKTVHPETVGTMTFEQAKAYWIENGRINGEIASLFFDPVYYLKYNADVAAAYGETNYSGAYTHFVNYGFWEGRAGSVLFAIKDYISHPSNQDIKKAFYPDKVRCALHFRQYGINECVTRDYRAGSNSFSVMSCLKSYNLTESTGYDFAKKYIRRNEVLRGIDTLEEVEALLFDASYYQEMNPNLNQDNDVLMRMPGETFEDKLFYHWKNYGIKEGRVASVYFDYKYYVSKYLPSGTSAADAYNHFLNTGFFAGNAGSAYYDGTDYLDGLMAKPVCLHLAMVTATKNATCTETGNAKQYCLRCKAHIKTSTIAQTPHIYTSVVTAPTCTEQGYTTHTCTVCGDSYVDSYVAALGHNYESVTSGYTVTYTCTSCGDTYTETVAPDPNAKNGIILENGLYYYYINDQIQYAAGLVCVNGDYYYIRSGGYAAIGSYWCTNTNGITQEGFYIFAEDGKMILTDTTKTGIYLEDGKYYYYIDGEIQFGAGLVMIDGSYYYIRSGGYAAIGSYWCTNTNGITAEGFYIFANDGKMILTDKTKTGIYLEDGLYYYYVEGEIQFGAGLVLVDGSYYYIRSGGYAATGEYYVSNTNGLLPEGLYTFGEDGKMIR